MGQQAIDKGDNRMKQVFYPYWEWEDYANGFYSKIEKTQEIEKIHLAVNLLSNENLFYSVAKEMISKWLKSSEQNLTDDTINKKAWIGQASCCYSSGVPEYLTREAWGQLTETQREKANAVATKVIDEYFEAKKGKTLWQNLA